MDQQELTPDGRFPSRFSNCNRSFKYDGKSRPGHELSHDPPLDIPNNLPGDDSVESEAISSESDGENKYTSTSEKDTDDIYNYNCALLEDGLFFINFLDAVSEGDDQRLMRQYFMLMCKADGSHSKKYALQCLYQLFLVKSLLAPQDSERFLWNRSINTLGGKGKNIALDLDMEHSNRFVKEAIRNLDPNVTENAVALISHTEGATLSDTVDQEIHKVLRSGRHT